MATKTTTRKASSTARPRTSGARGTTKTAGKTATKKR
jgi:hypothetical protein